MNYNILLNQDILEDLGKGLKQHRLNQNLTAKDLANKSGVSLRTITGFERGEKNISLLNLIEILRALRLLNNLESLFPKIPVISPLELIELEKKKRKRASK
ncbi:helix-turn-helix domain-containing protein [Changchengzhania lutea]|uniref:helix-turn-helix domain-containing protein n=1 Tax=Changchengzhania lutea TaxID=2049305 RepID=UPI00115E2403|nr:helix-turn-helix transcriptional regulator [Changchengzhania lutea]